MIINSDARMYVKQKQEKKSDENLTNLSTITRSKKYRRTYRIFLFVFLYSRQNEALFLVIFCFSGGFLLLVSGENLVSKSTCKSETFARGGNREVANVRRKATPYGTLRIASGTPNACRTLSHGNAISSWIDASPYDISTSFERMKATSQKSRILNLSFLSYE